MPASKPNVIALVEQMPETDRDIQLKQDEAKAQAQPDSPDKPKPRADRAGAASKFTGPDPAAAEKIFAEILSGGRESIVELLGLVRDPGDADFKDYKAGYVLHGLVILSGRTGQEKQHRLLAEILASQLSSDRHSKAVKGFMIRELRLLGGRDAVNVLGAQLLDEDLCSDATQALLSIRDGVAPHFRNALKKANGRTRVPLIQALGTLQDTDSSATLRNALVDEDRGVRQMAAWSLANIGDAESAKSLLKAADNAQGWERIEMTRVCLLMADRLAATKQRAMATQIYSHLRDTRNDSNERHIRETAEKALAALSR
jgi:HEAT repeat protein